MVHDTPSIFPRYSDAQFTVPEDLLGNCIWALEMFIRELNECTAEQLRAIGHITRNTPDHNLGSAMESLVRLRLDHCSC